MVLSYRLQKGIIVAAQDGLCSLGGDVEGREFGA
jgi:hypothetical protein